MTTKEQVKKFNDLFDPEGYKNDDLDSKPEYVKFFADILDSFATEKAVAMMFDGLKADDPLEEIKGWLLAMYLTGISSWREALIRAKPELADAIREFEREYILGEK